MALLYLGSVWFFNLSEEIDSAINKYAIKEHLDFGRIYAYEIDGFGNNLFMDDANVPSLMSLAYIDSKFRNDGIPINHTKLNKKNCTLT